MSFLILLVISFFGSVLVNATCTGALVRCGDGCYDPAAGEACCSQSMTKYACPATELRTIAATTTETSAGVDTTLTTETAAPIPVNPTAATISSGYPASVPVPDTPVAGASTSTGPCYTTTVYATVSTTVTGPPGPPGISINTSPDIGSSISTGVNGTSPASSPITTTTIATAPSTSVGYPGNSTFTPPVAPPVPGTTTATSVAGTSTRATATTASGSTSQQVPSSYTPGNSGSKAVHIALLPVIVFVAGAIVH